MIPAARIGGVLNRWTRAMIGGVFLVVLQILGATEASATGWCFETGGVAECIRMKQAPPRYISTSSNYAGCPRPPASEWPYAAVVYSSTAEDDAYKLQNFICGGICQPAPIEPPGSWVVTFPSADPDFGPTGRRRDRYWSWLAGGQCNVPSIEPAIQTEQSPLYCPEGWVGGTEVDGRYFCKRDPRPTCDQTPETCGGAGNPIEIGSGAKTQIETDYAAPFGPLGAVRRFYSSNMATPFASGKEFGTLGVNWRSEFDRAVSVYVGSQTIARHIRANGEIDYFRLSAGSYVPKMGGKKSLTVDGTGYHFSDENDEVENFDTSGRLVSIVARNGTSVSLTYSNASTPPSIAPFAGLVIAATDNFGRQIALTYDAVGRLSSMTDPAGRQYAYGYDSRGQLSGVQYPGGAARSYTYVNHGIPGLLSGIVDENGTPFAAFTYGPNSPIALTTEHAGGVNKFAVAVSGGTSTVTDPYNTTRTYIHYLSNGIYRLATISHPRPGALGSTKALSYDANGNVASRKGFNDKVTCYAYDLARNLETARAEGILSTEACATVLATPPNRPDVRTTTTTWHATYRLPLTVTEPAPGGSRTTTLTYDALGNLTQKSTVGPKNDGTSATVTRTWSWTVGAYGRVATATDPNGRVTTYAYYPDNDANLGRRGRLQSVTNPLGHVTQITAYDADGRPLTTIDPNGLTTNLTYDVRGRLTNRNVGGEQMTYVYDPVGQLTGVVLPDSATLTYVYDPAHRLTEIRDGLNNKIVYTLDAAGNRTLERVYDVGGTLARTRSRVYDSLNRLSQDIGAASQTTSYGYDLNGNLTSSTDPLLHATTNTYDALNRLVQVLDPAGGTTQYGYDAGNNLAQVTDARGLATSYTYDGVGNLTKLVSPDTGTTTSTFDAAGNVLTRTDARGATATYTIDYLNRATSVVFSRAGSPNETHSFTYDTGTNGKGRLTQLTDTAGTTTWTYTAQGRVATKNQTVGGVARTTAYGYNAAGQLASVTTPSGQQIGYGYLNNRVVGVTVNGSPLVSGIVTAPFGPVGAWQWGNGLYTFRDFDLDGRLWRWTHRNGTELIRNDLTFDASSRITGITDPLSAARNGTYTYDVVDRLATAQQGTPATHSYQYAYDPLGNRTGAVVDGAASSLAYGGTSNRLESMVGAVPSTYFNGLTSVSFVYNNANRLAEVQSGGTLATYSVNGLGQRVKKVVGATTTIFVYDERGRMLGEYDGTGALVQETVWLDDMPIATLRPTGTGTPTPIAVHYVHADHLGTPRVVTRPSDNATEWRWDNAEPFGNTAANENPSGLGTFKYNLRFPGQYYDAEVGTNYNYFRDYDPAVGRYSQSDPIGLRGGINSYAYVGGNPLSLTDPNGLQPCCSSPFVSDQQCCDTLKARGEDRGSGGGVACCNGRKVACNWNPSGGDPQSDSITHECVIEHENVHFGQTMPCKCEGIYRVGGEMWNPGQDPQAGECAAHRAQLSCLKRGLARCGSNVRCKSLIGAEINIWTRYIMNNCGGVF